MGDRKQSSTPEDHGASNQEVIVRMEQDRAKSNAPEHLELVESSVVVPELSGQEAKQVPRQLYIRLLPILAFFYLLAYLDRGNSKLGHCSI